MTQAPPDQARPDGLRRAARFLWLWAPLVAYMGVIFALSSTPRPLEMLQRFVPSDKAAHLGEYAVLGLLMSRALFAAGLTSPTATSIGLGSLYGITDEFHQHFVPGRTMDVFDWLADVLGMAVGAIVWRQCWALRSRRAKRGPSESRRRGGRDTRLR